MRKQYLWIAALMLGMALCGCKTNNEEETVSSVEECVKETENTDIEEITEEPVFDEVIELKEEKTSGNVLEDEKALYFVGEDRICRYEKDSNSSHNIWESPENKTEDTRFIYKDAGGILIGDTLYFIEKEKDDADNDRYSLSMVGTDGSGYEKIREIGQQIGRALSVVENVLYYEYDETDYTLSGYQIGPDGKLLMDAPVTIQLENIPDGYSMPFYYKHGYRMLNFAESKSRYGIYLLRNEDYRYCLIDTETGEETSLPESLDTATLFAVNDTDWLFASYADEEMYLYNPQNGEVRDLCDFNTDTNIIDMDEEYLYQQTMVSGSDFTQYHYERVSLESGETEEVFVKDKMIGIGITDPREAMEPVFLNGYLYYPGEDEYKLYIMRRDVDMPHAEEKLGDAFYDSHISELGEVKTQKDTIYGQADPQFAIAYWDLEWLVLDDKYGGAAQINQILEKEQTETIEYEKDNAVSVEEEALDEENGTYYYYYSYESSLSPLRYWDGTYLCFTQQNYDYMGGAHGMPYWMNYVFNVHTGERLGLGDIVAEDENQIKELVKQAFTLVYEKNPDIYWENAVDCVYEYTCMDSPFYLTEEGIVFYFGPYELAPFSAGFQEVLVPYDAWTLKIDLEW